MKIEEYINKWGYCRELLYLDKNLNINRLNLVYYDDQQLLIENGYTDLFHCIDNYNGYLVLQFKDRRLRVLKEAINIILPEPQFIWKDRVQEVLRPNIEGYIEDIEWHFQEKDYKYYIIINGKRKSRRYNSQELFKV